VSTPLQIDPTAADAALSEALELLLIRVGEEHFALPLSAVEEAAEFDRVEALPGAHPESQVIGALPLRGALLPVFRPEGTLHAALRGGDSTLVIVLRRGDTRLAIQVDDVEDVLTLSPDRVLRSPISHGVTGAGEASRGMIRDGNRLITLLDAEALAAACLAASEAAA